MDKQRLHVYMTQTLYDLCVEMLFTFMEEKKHTPNKTNIYKNNNN